MKKIPRYEIRRADFDDRAILKSCKNFPWNRTDSALPCFVSRFIHYAFKSILLRVLDFYSQRDIRQTALRVKVFGLAVRPKSHVFLSNGVGVAAPLTISSPQHPADRVAYERQTKITASKLYAVIHDVSCLLPSSLSSTVSFSFLVYSQSRSPSLFQRNCAPLQLRRDARGKIKKLRVTDVKEIHRHCVVVRL